MKIALCQTSPISGEKATNLVNAEAAVEATAADLVVLPEMFATGYSVEPEAVAEPMEGVVVNSMRRWACSCNKAIAGSVLVSERGRCYNRMVFAMPDGGICCYDKRHLFSFSGEQERLTAGSERMIVTFGGVRILPLICYDLRFAAWSYLPGQVDLIIYSASWAADRIGAWDRLLPARAIENQAFVAGVNRVGSDSTAAYNGHSALYDFYGREIVSAGESERVVEAEIDTAALDAYRNKFRAWADADKFKFEK